MSLFRYVCDVHSKLALSPSHILSPPHIAIPMHYLPDLYQKTSHPSLHGCPTAAVGRFSTESSLPALHCPATLAIRTMPALSGSSTLGKFDAHSCGLDVLVDIVIE